MLVSHVTDSLDRQELMLDIVGSSIKKAGKKLHRLELMMHNEPAEDAELRDKVAWHEKMDKLLRYDVAKRLPTLREVKILKYQKHKSLLQKKSGHTTLMENLKRPNSRHHLEGKSLEQFRASKRQKEPGPSFFLGSRPEGEVIRVVKNYNGANTSFRNDRTLVTKDGRYGKGNHPKSSLPEWFHPGYYETDLQSKEMSPGSHQLPFKSTGRNHVRRDQESRARELEQRSLLYQAAEEAAISSGEEELFYGPGYTSPIRCSRPHSQLPASDLQSRSTWSRSSAGSTIGRPVAHSGMQSPQTVHLSTHGEHREGRVSYDEVVSEFLDTDSTNHSLRSSKKSPSIGDMLSTSSVDSVLLKTSHRDKAKYRPKDYTMGALDMQQRRPLVIPEPDDEVPPPRRVIGRGESTRGSAFSVTSAAAQEQAQRISRSRPKHRATSKAAVALKGAQQDLHMPKGSVVFDEEIPFCETMGGFVEKWRSERNFVPLDPIRPKSSGPRDPPKHVDFNNLLIDNSTLTEEESRSLMSEFSKELTDLLSFL